MLTITLALSGVVVWGFCDLLIAQFTRHVATVTAIAVTTLVSFALALPLALAVGGVPEGAAEWRAVGFAAAGGVFYLAAYGSLVAALSRGDLSVVAPLAALDGAFGAILAIALGDPVNAITAVGLTLAAGGGALAAAQPRRAPEAAVAPIPGGAPAFAVASEASTPGATFGLPALDPAGDPRVSPVPADPPERRRLAAGAGYALLSGLSIAVALQFFGHTDEVSATTTVAVARAVSLAMIVPVALATTGLVIARRLWPAAVLIGATDVAGFVFVAAATARGPVSVVAVLVAQLALMGIVLGLVVLRERPAPRQLAGAALAIAGVTVLAVAA